MAWIVFRLSYGRTGMRMKHPSYPSFFSWLPLNMLITGPFLTQEVGTGSTLLPWLLLHPAESVPISIDGMPQSLILSLLQFIIYMRL